LNKVRSVNCRLAGIGAPSDAALAFREVADAVLVNTAMAVCKKQPCRQMGKPFVLLLKAGRIAYEFTV